MEEKKKGSRAVKTIINLIIWIAVLGWIGVVGMDYYNVTHEKEPKFCIKKGTTEYADGTVDWCTGIGYKAFKYKRTSSNLTFEFGPFWIVDRTAENK